VSGPSQRAAARRQARTASAGASTAVAALRRPGLTGRAVVLAAVLALLVFTLAVPTRELVRQRAEINELRAANEAAQGRVAELVVRQERLQDPAYVTSLIRERLHYVLPGEIGYVVLDPDEAPAPQAPSAAEAPSWYATLWSAVQTADGTVVPTPEPSRIPTRPDAPR
jgi:cell division protein FtsB